jgi:hypothetical protein
VLHKARLERLASNEHSNLLDLFISYNFFIVRLSAIILLVIMPSLYVESHYAVCRYFKCLYAKCCGALQGHCITEINLLIHNFVILLLALYSQDFILLVTY